MLLLPVTTSSAKRSQRSSSCAQPAELSITVGNISCHRHSRAEAESAEGGASKTQTSERAGAREMVEVRGTGILQLSCSSRESGQPSKFSVTGDPVLDVCASAPQPEESDDLAATRGYRGPLAPQT